MTTEDAASEIPEVLHEMDPREKGVVHTITVSNPAKLNVLDSSLMQALRSTLRRCGEDPEARVVVLRGAGTHAWVGGADIREMAALDADGAVRFIRRLQSVFQMVRDIPVPVVAVIRGYCLGAGLELAACCDLRLGCEDSSYGMPEDFDPGSTGLHPCHMRVLEGHIFVNLSRGAGPPDFDEATKYYLDVARKYAFAKLKIGARRFYPIRANWKLAIENFLECYHCGPSHRSLVTTHNWDYTLTPEQKARRLNDLAGWVCEESKRRAAEEQKKGSMGSSYTAEYTGELNPGFVTGSLDGKPVAPLLPGIGGWTHCTDIATTGWSTGYWQAYDDHVAVARFTPRDAASTDCEIFWLVHPDAVEGRDYKVERLMALWDITIQEDIWIVENNHLGILSSAYGPGRYAGHEGGPSGFITWYMTEVAKS